MAGRKRTRAEQNQPEESEKEAGPVQHEERLYSSLSRFADLSTTQNQKRLARNGTLSRLVTSWRDLFKDIFDSISLHFLNHGLNGNAQFCASKTANKDLPELYARLQDDQELSQLRGLAILIARQVVQRTFLDISQGELWQVEEPFILALIEESRYHRIDVERFMRSTIRKYIQSEKWQREDAAIRSRRYSRATIGVLSDHIDKLYCGRVAWNDYPMADFIDALDKIFMAAINMRALLDVVPAEFSIFWPTEGQPMAGSVHCMGIEMDEVDDCLDNAFAGPILFPGLKMIGDGGSDYIVHKARVDVRLRSRDTESGPTKAASGGTKKAPKGKKGAKNRRVEE